MNESHKYSDTESCVVYKQNDGTMELSMMFNKDTRTVDIQLMRFMRNDVPMLEPMESKWIQHSAKYGRWQQIFPTLGVEDVEFLHKKTMELFGGKAVRNE